MPRPKSWKRDIRTILFVAGASGLVYVAISFIVGLDQESVGRSLSAGSLVLTTEPSTRTTFLLGIFSMSTEDERVKRQLIRDTYLGDDVRFCPLQEFSRLSIRGWSRCKVPYVFVIGGNDSGMTELVDNDRMIMNHSIVAGAEEDAIYLNIQENMEDGKSTSWLRYAVSLTTELDIDYIAKTDSDTLFYPKYLFEVIERDLPSAPYNRRIYGGKTEINTRIDRGSIYAAGQFYFMSSDLAHYVSKTLSVAQRQTLSADKPTEDIDIGSYVFSHPRPVRMVFMSHHRIWVHLMKEISGFKNHYDKMLAKKRVKIKRDNAFEFEEMCKYWADLGQV